MRIGSVWHPPEITQTRTSDFATQLTLRPDRVPAIGSAKQLRSSTGHGSNQYEHTAENDAKSHGVVGEQLFTHGQIILRRTFRLDDAHIGRSLGLRMDES
jgi:hypothetical protein